MFAIVKSSYFEGSTLEVSKSVHVNQWTGWLGV